MSRDALAPHRELRTGSLDALSHSSRYPLNVQSVDQRGPGLRDR
ncbi:hypothetical protein RBSH_02786 [Rhodopirellula baltica SH28]|uniref:Uncharacterized protein n=1 Tax=Rhodopirellula baltica SH28 TaxID=993517 RepID=K5E809_RHOBT|nr:hypothetical protein RBSH_02786 [Rhodopirellula baltica SH28]